ncbi:MAG TPA: hypothetical protein VLW45_10680 [Pelomicrobium sp.]|nr:hypothetical protein [Pelomicrobium sp.]
MSEWDGIRGVDAWRRKLQTLTEEAKALALDDDLEKRFALVDRLNAFILHSRPNNQSIQALDAIAADTATSLMQATVAERLQALAERGAELALLTKELEGHAAAAAASAQSIRLERARKAVDSMTETVSSLKELKRLLGSSDDAELARGVEQAINTLQRIRNAIERTA